MNQTAYNYKQAELMGGDQFSMEYYPIVHPMAPMDDPHYHGHIEVNFLIECHADYSLNGSVISIPQARLAMFWANIPHIMDNLKGDGFFYVINVPLMDFLSLNIPAEMRREVLSGNLVYSKSTFSIDAEQLHRWYNESQSGDAYLESMVKDEVGLKIRRMGYEGWHTFRPDHHKGFEKNKVSLSSFHHASQMTAFIKEFMAQPLTVKDVASHVGLQPNYASNIFTGVIGESIKQYVLRQRVEKARTQLVETDLNVTTIAFNCGFGSLSRFYDTFSRHFGLSPKKFRQQMKRDESSLS